jgi:hypothetical protein
LKAVAGILVVREAQRHQYPTDFRNELLLQERAICGFEEEWALLVSPSRHIAQNCGHWAKVTARLAEDDVHTSAELVSLGLAEAEPEHLRFQGVVDGHVTPREVQPGVEVRRRTQ